ncbi:DUF1318 domain-containing protein [Thermodesulfobacteriota bacterium]
MKVIRNTVFLVVVSTFISLIACITINIYFPAEKVESVAGDIVNDIRGTGENKRKNMDNNKDNSLLKRSLFAFFCSNAWAEEVTEVSNATIRALKQEMKARYAKMKPLYEKGALKEGDDGFVSVGDTSGLGLREKRNLNALVDAENKDREKLYKEVAKALEIDPSQTQKIAEIFAKEWKKSVR